MLKTFGILLLVIIVGVCMFFALLQPNPHIVIINKIRGNCLRLSEAVRRYGKTNGAYPQSSRLVNSDTSSLKNPISSSDTWVIEKIVTSEKAAVEFSNLAHAGQVIFCPLMKNGKVVDFYIMGMGEDGLIFDGDDKPMVLSKDHEN